MFWWHGEPRVTGKQVEHGVDVAGLDGGCEAAGELAFAGGARRRRVLAAGGQACLERGPGALQGAFDGGLAAAQRRPAVALRHVHRLPRAAASLIAQ
jgi:hypothetical protein